MPILKPESLWKNLGVWTSRYFNLCIEKGLIMDGWLKHFIFEELIIAYKLIPTLENEKWIEKLDSNKVFFLLHNYI